MGHVSQLEIERPVQQLRTDRTRPGPKSILVHLQHDDTLQNRIDNALALARASDAHVEFLHVTPYEAYTTLDGLGGVFVTTDVVRMLQDQDADLRTQVERQLKGEDVSWNYVQVTASIIDRIISHAALADLIVTSREPKRGEYVGSTVGFLGELISRSRTPVFVPCLDRIPVDPTGAALIGWDGSYEAATAVRSALPLLQMASAVHVVNVRSDEPGDFPGTRILEYLSRHGIHANLQEVNATKERPLSEFVAAALMGHAAEYEAAYMVMGGYNHSRLREFMFGGVTRTMLSGCTVPLVISH